MSGISSTILTENAFKQASQTAERLGLTGLSRWLESSGPLLKLATISEDASYLVHNYRTVRDIAATSTSDLVLEGYRRIRGDLDKLIKSSNLEQELRDIIELELRRTDVFITGAGDWSKRVVVPPLYTSFTMTQQGADLLSHWSVRMKDPNISNALKNAYAKFLTRIPKGDIGWASIAELALDRAKRAKKNFPNITRSNYTSNPRAIKLIEESYTVHGKGLMFEHIGRNHEKVKNFMDNELRAATYRAAPLGSESAPVLSVGEIRYGVRGKNGNTVWRQGPDYGVFIATESKVDPKAFAALEVQGIAEPTAFFQLKSEREGAVSGITGQQEHDLPSILQQYDKGNPVYVEFGVMDNTGQIKRKKYLLKPPDSKDGLSYYGIATSQVYVAESEILAKQGANVSNINLDHTNSEGRDLWHELFWTAFESL